MLTEPISPGELSRLIGLIYDCAVEPEAWQVALVAIRECINCCAVQLGIHNLTDRSIILAKNDGISDYWLERQNEFTADMYDLWSDALGVRNRSLDQPLLARQFIPDEKMFSNRYYREWALPQGHCDAGIVLLIMNERRIASVGFSRHESVGIMGERESQILALLAPHLRRAAIIADLIDTTTVMASSYKATLDVLNKAVVLVDKNCNIVHANQQARRMLSNKGPICSVDGSLKAGSLATSNALTAAVAKAEESDVSIGRAGLGLPLDSGNGQRFLAYVLPLRQGKMRRQFNAAAAVFISAASGKATIPLEILEELYDLTPAECQVLLHVGQGDTVNATASALNVAVSTTRTHLSRIFAKTGTARQADLIKLVQALNPP